MGQLVFGDLNKYHDVLQRVLVTVKAYPNPSRTYRETVCVAGVNEAGRWIRLFPVCFRDFEEGHRFKNYTWITVSTRKSDKDRRPESYHIDQDSIKVEQTVSTQDNWRERWSYLRPLVSPSLEELHRYQGEVGTSLGLIKPKRILSLVIEPDVESDWNARSLSKLLKQDLFDPAVATPRKHPIKLLEKIPFKFSYRFECDDPACKGHKLSIISWEVMESYRSWRQKYGDAGWQAKFREKFERQLLARDLHFFVGTMHAHPTNWLIIGLYYPPLVTSLGSRDIDQLTLF